MHCLCSASKDPNLARFIGQRVPATPGRSCEIKLRTKRQKRGRGVCVCMCEGCGEQQQRSPEVAGVCMGECVCVGMGEECADRASGRAGLIRWCGVGGNPDQL